MTDLDTALTSPRVFYPSPIKTVCTSSPRVGFSQTAITELPHSSTTRRVSTPRTKSFLYEPQPWTSFRLPALDTLLKSTNSIPQNKDGYIPNVSTDSHTADQTPSQSVDRPVIHQRPYSAAQPRNPFLLSPRFFQESRSTTFLTFWSESGQSPNSCKESESLYANEVMLKSPRVSSAVYSSHTNHVCNYGHGVGQSKHTTRKASSTGPHPTSRAKVTANARPKSGSSPPKGRCTGSAHLAGTLTKSTDASGSRLSLSPKTTRAGRDAKPRLFSDSDISSSVSYASSKSTNPYSLTKDTIRRLTNGGIPHSGRRRRHSTETSPLPSKPAESPELKSILKNSSRRNSIDSTNTDPPDVSLDNGSQGDCSPIGSLSVLQTSTTKPQGKTTEAPLPSENTSQTITDLTSQTSCEGFLRSFHYRLPSETPRPGDPITKRVTFGENVSTMLIGPRKIPKSARKT